MISNMFVNFATHYKHFYGCFLDTAISEKYELRYIFAPFVRTFAQFSFVQAHKKRVGNQVFSEKKILKSSAIHMNHIVQGTQIEIRNVKFITAQCGKTRNSLSRYIDKNFVKVMLLLIQCVEKYYYKTQSQHSQFSVKSTLQ